MVPRTGCLACSTSSQGPQWGSWIGSSPGWHVWGYGLTFRPSGTTLEVPDPDEGMEYPQRRYQIYLKSQSGPVEVFLVSQTDGDEAAAASAADASAVAGSGGRRGNGSNGKRARTAEAFYCEYNAMHQYGGKALQQMAPLPPHVRAMRPLLANLWLGRGATTSPLHYDEYENLLCQVAGRKRLLLFPPAAEVPARKRGAASTFASSRRLSLSKLSGTRERGTRARSNSTPGSTRAFQCLTNRRARGPPSL